MPEYLAEMRRCNAASELLKSVGDNSLMAYYYLLLVSEYTLKRGKKKSTQTEQFKLEDCRFFKLDKFGQLKPLSKFASDEDIMHANIATLKLNNQKNGWKGVCVHQHANREKIMCGVHAIGHCYCYIHEASGGD